MVDQSSPDKLIANILKHDVKQNSYKIALLRAINDVVLAFPDMLSQGRDVAIPLRLLARYWIAYYWSFVETGNPIYQGVRNRYGDGYRNDVAFRPALARLRQEWETLNQTSSASDGFALTNAMSIPRKRKEFTEHMPDLARAYNRALKGIERAIEQPTRYAGTALEGTHSVFQPHAHLHEFQNVSPIPGTQPDDRCIVVPTAIWETLRELSLWVEALCIHEWALFVEGVDQKDRPSVGRGEVFELLTARPDNRVPLTWERNQIFILMQEGVEFTCIWSQQPLGIHDAFDLDHLVPVSVYPMNEMWNLIPTHPAANKKKRDKIPTPDLLQRAVPGLISAYGNYQQHLPLATALQEDSRMRFSTLTAHAVDFPHNLAHRVIDFMEHIADSRSLARVEGF